jgi:ABC-2 type transport system permease protein
MAPISVRLVMMEKIVMGMFEAWVATAFVFPVAYFIMRANLHLHLTSSPGLILFLLMSGLAAATLGMVLGTVVEPMRFAMMFATTIIPMIFLGATYYPWKALAKIPWLQYLVLINPLVYISEGYRSLLTPTVPHMSYGITILGIAVSIAILLAVAIRTFERRALN